MKTEHTKGPWVCGEIDNRGWSAIDLLKKLLAAILCVLALQLLALWNDREMLRLQREQNMILEQQRMDNLNRDNLNSLRDLQRDLDRR